MCPNFLLMVTLATSTLDVPKVFQELGCTDLTQAKKIGTAQCSGA